MRTIFTKPPILSILLIAVTCFVLTHATAAQDCPPDKVCISPAAAKQALEDSDTVKAQETEIKGLKQAIEDFRKTLNDMRIEFARVSGENTALKQNAVSDRAIISELLKHTKKKCLPFSVCF